MTETTEASPTTRVARDLTAIEDLYAQLPDQAINDSDSPMMPGGRAMIALGPVANHEAWESMTQATERYGKAYTFAEEEDPDDAWPAFQLIAFWSETWRAQHGAEYGQRPTLPSEVNFLRYLLDWAWDNEPAFDDFAADIHKARIRLEDITGDGKRNQRGVKCLDCNIDLIRPSRDAREPHACDGTDDGLCVWPHRFCPHDRGGLADEWKCPQCKRRYDRDDYFRAVHHAHFVHADYLTLDDAAARTGELAGTIKVWAHRKKVRKYRDPETRRMTYCVADIEAASLNPEEVA